MASTKSSNAPRIDIFQTNQNVGAADSFAPSIQEGFVDRNLSGGMYESLGGLAQGAETLASVIGADDAANYLDTVAQGQYTQADAYHPAKFNNVSQINGAGDFFEAIGEGALRSAPGLVIDALAAVGTAGVGSVLTKATSLLGKAARAEDVMSIAADVTNPLSTAMKSLLGEALANKIKDPTVLSKIAGATAGQAVQNIGDARSEMIGEGVYNADTAMETGLQNTGIDVAATALVGAPIVKQMFGNAAKKTDSGITPPTYNSAIRAGTNAASVGAGTEAAQWANTQDSIQQEKALAGEQYDWMTKDKLGQGALEALGGAGMGGALGAGGQTIANLYSGSDQIAETTRNAYSNVRDFFKEEDTSEKTVSGVGDFLVKHGVVSQEKYDSVVQTFGANATGAKNKIMEAFGVTKEKLDDLKNGYKKQFISDMDEDTQAFADHIYNTADDVLREVDIPPEFAAELDAQITATSGRVPKFFDSALRDYALSQRREKRTTSSINNHLINLSHAREQLKEALDARNNRAPQMADLERVQDAMDKVTESLAGIDKIQDGLSDSIIQNNSNAHARHALADMPDNTDSTSIADRILSSKAASSLHRAATTIKQKTVATANATKKLAQDRKELADFIWSKTSTSTKNIFGVTKDKMTPDSHKKRADYVEFTPEMHDKLSNSSEFAAQVLEAFKQAVKDNGAALAQKVKSAKPTSTTGLDAKDYANHNVNLVASALLSAAKSSLDKVGGDTFLDKLATVKTLIPGLGGDEFSSIQVDELPPTEGGKKTKLKMPKMPTSLKDTVQQLSYTTVESGDKTAIEDTLNQVDTAIGDIKKLGLEVTPGLFSELNNFKKALESGDKTSIAEARQKLKVQHEDNVDTKTYNNVDAQFARAKKATMDAVTPEVAKLLSLVDGALDVQARTDKLKESAKGLFSGDGETKVSVKDLVQSIAFTPGESKTGAAKQELLDDIDTAIATIDSQGAESNTEVRDELQAYKDNIERGDPDAIANNRRNLQTAHTKASDAGAYSATKRRTRKIKDKVKKSKTQLKDTVSRVQFAETTARAAKKTARAVKKTAKNTAQTVTNVVDDVKSEMNDNSADLADTRSRDTYSVSGNDFSDSKPPLTKGLYKGVAQRKIKQLEKRDDASREAGTLKDEYTYSIESLGKTSKDNKEKFAIKRTAYDGNGVYKDSMDTTRTKKSSVMEDGKTKRVGATQAQGSVAGAKLTRFVNSALASLNMGNINAVIASGGKAESLIRDLGLDKQDDAKLIRRIKEDVAKVNSGKANTFFGRVYMKGDSMVVLLNPKMPQTMHSVVLAHEIGEAHFELNYNSLTGAARKQLEAAYKQHLKDNDDIDTSTYNEREFYADQIARFLHDNSNNKPKTLIDRIAKKFADSMKNLYKLAMRTVPNSIKARMRRSDGFVRFIDLVLAGEPGAVDDSKAKENFANAVYRNYTGEEAINSLLGK